MSALARFIPRIAREALDRLGESLHHRLVASFLAMAAAVVAFVALAAFLRARATLRTQVLGRLEAVALDKEGDLNLWIDDQVGDLAFLASLEAVRADAERLAGLPETARDAAALRASLVALLDTARARTLDMDEVFVLAPVGGRVVATTDPARLGDYRVSDLFFRRGLTGSTVQNVYASPLTGRPTITVAAPVRGADGRPVAVLAGHLRLSRIDRILAERTGLGATGEAYLVTPFHDFVSGQRFGRAGSRRGLSTAGVREALAGRNGSRVYAGYAGARVLGAWRWSPARQLALMVEQSAAEAFAPARELVGTILAFGFVAVLLLGIGIVLVARRITQPILGVAAAADRVARGDFDAVAPVLTRDEVGVLARAFNDMTRRLRELYDDLSEQIGATGRAYRALEESQQLLQASVDNTVNLFVALDRDGRFLLVNRRLEDLFGVRRDEMRGRTSAALPRDLAEVVDALAREALAGTPARPVERDAQLRVGGVPHHYHLLAFPLTHGGRRPFGAGIVGVDLTERVKAEEEHRRLETGVQQAQKLESLGLLAGGIAHDFNNILTAIVGGAAMAADALDPQHPARTDLEQVITAAERAAKLTRQMLAYAGRASFAVETFDLDAVIREMAELIQVSVAKTVRLAHEPAPGLPPIRADRTQVSQIVLNLVTNAAEASTAAGGTVVVRTRARAAAELAHGQFRFAPADAAQYVELSVDDNGAGMSAETMEKMFDPFYSTKGTGRGLGLAAVLGIVRQSGGALRVTSTPGRGSTFTVLFPAVAGQTGSAAPAPATAEPREASGTVLLVDDEDLLRTTTRRALERAGYRVLEAANGREAVEIFQRESPRLAAIVLDVTMPVMGGAEAFRQMRVHGPPVPVMVSSGYDEQDTAAAFAGEAVEFLQKPYKPSQLLTRLRDLVAAARAG